jgi:O-methyltransferase
MLLKRLLAAARTRVPAAPYPEPELPLDVEARTVSLHSRAAVQRHLDILYGDVRIGPERYTDLYFRCLERTGTAVTPFTIFQRFQTRLDLVRYLLATADVPGARAECGAYRGATALLLCHALRSRSPGFDGDGFYLIDSFSGTPESDERDLIPVRDGNGAIRMESFFPPRKTDVRVEMVRSYFQEFPRARVEQGWIPEVLERLPTPAWAYAHIDLTLYAPTLSALEYFYPRLSPGGVLVCEGSLFCPGVQKAVDAYSSAHDVPYVTLGHRELVFIKP